jgi:primosomal protein N' (replication factor Y)
MVIAGTQIFTIDTITTGSSGRVWRISSNNGTSWHPGGQDYASFAEGELAQRREAGFPPFGRIVCFRWRGPREGSVERAARAGMDRLKLKKGDWATLGPSPSPLARLRGQYRWQALLLGPVAGELKRAARDVLGSMRELAGGLGVDLAVVVDPQTTM